MPIPSKVPQIKRELMREKIYTTLREWIVSHTLEPGEKLRDDELAAHLGVSRTPVREALRRLEDEGLVETAPNQWTRVSMIDITEAERLYPIVWTLESLAVSLAMPHLVPNDLETMRRINHRFAQAIEANVSDEAMRLDTQFHAIYIDRSQNADLIQILLCLKARIRRISSAFFHDMAASRISITEHEAIVEALGGGNIAEAQAAVRANWQAGLERLLTVVEAQHKRES